MNFQLFKVIPEREFINRLSKLYGIQELSPNFKFTLYDLCKNNTIKKIREIDKELQHYYINCKYKQYLSKLTDKKCITILRHFLKIINYKVVSREKYSNNSKYLLYEIVDVNEYVFDPNDFIVSFD
jgi:hypothetical protein